MWALILDGVVAELVEDDPLGRFHPELKFVPAEEGVHPGMLYDGEAFTAPPAAPPAPRALSKAELLDRVAAAGKIRPFTAFFRLGEPAGQLSDDELLARAQWEAAPGFTERDPRLLEALKAAALDADAIFKADP